MKPEKVKFNARARGRNKNTGPMRKIWNKFKRGMSEINFILNITQTLVILWASESYGQMFTNFYVFFILASMVIGFAAISVGGFAIKNVDPTLSILNPFAQDMVKQRQAISMGLYFLAEDNQGPALTMFKLASDITERWIE